MHIDITSTWRTTYPGAYAGFLAMSGVSNPPDCPPLEQRKRELEEDLRARFGSMDRKLLAQLPPLPAYAAYYQAFQKNYHVQGQLESVVYKGKSLPHVAALVEAMFMAELKNRLLTAGHDLDFLSGSLKVDVARGGEIYNVLRGPEQALKAGDMFMADQQGAISSILYGPDSRTQIRAETRNVLFAVYAPRGVSAEDVRAHLIDIRAAVQVVEPGAQEELLAIFGADEGRLGS